MKLSWLVAVPLLICTGSALGARRQSRTVKPLSVVEQNMLRAIAQKVKQAILDADVEGLLGHISKTSGLTCTDTNYSYGEVRAFLHDKRSHLYMSLFDSAEFARRCGSDYSSEYPAIADNDFLRTANQSVTIARLDNDWAQVTFTTPIKNHYPREWYFHREAGTWRVASGSFIIGSCSCG